MTDFFSRDLLGTIPSLRAFARSLGASPDRADDLVQETLIKAWANQTSFVQGTNLKTWLFTILRNTAYSDYRKRWREVEDGDGSYAAGLVTQPNQIAHLDMRQVVFIDSSGLWAVTLTQRICRTRGIGLMIEPGPQPVQSVFEVTGLADLLPFVPASAATEVPVRGTL